MTTFDIFCKKKKISENDSSETCKTIKETKSRNLVSAAQSMWKRQMIFGRPGHNGAPGPNRVKTGSDFGTVSLKTADFFCLSDSLWEITLQNEIDLLFISSTSSTHPDVSDVHVSLTPDLKIVSQCS